MKGWYPNGCDREALKPGDVRDFGDATSGLMQAGHIAPADDAEPVIAAESTPSPEPEITPEPVIEVEAEPQPPENPEPVAEPVVEKPHGNKKKHK